MKIRFSLLAAVMTTCIAPAVFAQSQNLSDPDVLGIHLGMQKKAVEAKLKVDYPGAKIERTLISFTTDTSDLYTDMQWKVTLDKLKPSTLMDLMTISFLPDDTVLAVERMIAYREHKQLASDISQTMRSKYGSHSYSASDNKSIFADDIMWSDRMGPGMEMTGTGPAFTGRLPKGDFTDVAPYPACKEALAFFTSHMYKPKDIYNGLTDKSDFDRNRAALMKPCGKMVYARTEHENRQYYYATKTTIFMGDLSTVYDQILRAPEMAKRNPKAIFATEPKTKRSVPSPDTPNM